MENLMILFMLFLFWTFSLSKLYFWVTEGAPELPLDSVVSFTGGAAFLIMVLVLFMMIVFILILGVCKVYMFVVLMLTKVNFSKLYLFCLSVGSWAALIKEFVPSRPFLFINLYAFVLFSLGAFVCVSYVNWHVAANREALELAIEVLKSARDLLEIQAAELGKLSKELGASRWKW